MKRLFLAVLFCALSQVVYSTTTYTSTGSGNWNNGSTWSSSGSGSPNRYIILSGHTVTLTSTPLFIDSIKVYGVLNFNSNIDLLMSNGGMLEIFSGGSITGGSNNSDILFFLAGLSSIINGPWTGSGIVNGPAYANKSTNGFISMALPIHMLSFTSTVEGNAVHLKWITADELNNDHFDVQRSNDGISWFTIGTVQGHGTTNTATSYAYIDPSPFDGYNYYRLVQVDQNSSRSLSQIVYARVGSQSVQLSAYPNPASNVITLNTVTEDNPDTEDMSRDLVITDQTGRTLSLPIRFSPYSAVINTENLTDGIYYLSIASLNYKEMVVVKH